MKDSVRCIMVKNQKLTLWVISYSIFPTLGTGRFGLNIDPGLGAMVLRQKVDPKYNVDSGGDQPIKRDQSQYYIVALRHHWHGRRRPFNFKEESKVI